MSSTVSCSRAAHSVSSSVPSSARIVATASGWVMYGIAALTLLIAVVVGGHVVGPLDQPQVGLGVGRTDRPEQRLQHRIHGATPLPPKAREPTSYRRLLLGGPDWRNRHRLPERPSRDRLRQRYVGHDHITGHSDSLHSSPDPPVYPGGEACTVAGVDQTITRECISTRRQPLAPLEEGELHQHGEADDFGAGPADQLHGRRRRAAGGEHVVDDQNPVAGAKASAVHLDGGGAVLQIVGLLKVAEGSLPFLRTGTNPAPAW